MKAWAGYKVKELADALGVPIGRVRYWVAEELLLTKGGRAEDGGVGAVMVSEF